MPEKKYVLDRCTLAQDDLLAMRATAIADGDVVTYLGFEGQCPNCPHLTREFVPVGVIADDESVPAENDFSIGVFKLRRSGVRFWRRENGHARPIVVTCHCATDHPGSKGAFGCGRSWMVIARFDPAGNDRSVALSLPTAADLAQWQRVVDAEAASTDPVKTVRDAGDKWQKALAGLFGIVSVTAIVGGRDTLAKLAEPWPSIFATAVAAILSLTAWATYNAHRAAIGFPKYQSIADADSLAAYAGSPLAQARAAVGRIRDAVLLGFIAFGLTVATLFGLLMVPGKPSPAPTQAHVTLTTGEDLKCATIVPSSDAAKVKLSLPNNAETEVPWQNIAKLATAEC